VKSSQIEADLVPFFNASEKRSHFGSEVFWNVRLVELKLLLPLREGD
jgi:hypothetical protein